MKRLSPNDKGIGRPFAGDDRKSINLQMRMSPSEVSELDDMAHEMQSTRSGVIRKGLQLVRDWLDKRNS